MTSQLSPQERALLGAIRDAGGEKSFDTIIARNLATKLALQGVLYSEGQDYKGNWVYKLADESSVSEEDLLTLFSMLPISEHEDTVISDPTNYEIIDELIKRGYVVERDHDDYSQRVISVTPAGARWYVLSTPKPAPKPAPKPELKLNIQDVDGRRTYGLVKEDNVEAILNERQTTYGDYADVARTAQNLKHVLRAVGDNYPSKPYQMESLDMICNKLARIVNGDPDYIDSWDDIAGYATLVSKELNRSEV